MSGFREIQERLTGWLREPGRVAPPDNVEKARLEVYRELLLNNVRSFVENGFPVLRAMTPDDVWDTWLEAYFASHRATSPYFRDIPGEFFQWLQARAGEDAPWITELAHFEWMGMLADVAEGEYPSALPGDVLVDGAVLSPFVWPLVYHWPVHTYPVERPEPSPLPVALLMFRTEDHKVMTLDVPLAVALLVESWQADPAPLGALLERMARNHGVPVPELERQILPWLDPLRENGILRGVPG